MTPNRMRRPTLMEEVDNPFGEIKFYLDFHSHLGLIYILGSIKAVIGSRFLALR